LLPSTPATARPLRISKSIAPN